MDGPFSPEPGDGRYFLVGVLAVLVIILGIEVAKHPMLGPAPRTAAHIVTQPISAADYVPAR
jgi:hypothetical protein